MSLLARLGRLYHLMGHDDEAEPILLEAIGKDPQAPRAFYSLGFLYESLDRLEEAKARSDLAVR